MAIDGKTIGGMDTLVKIQSCEIGRGSQAQKTYAFSDHSEVFAKIESSVDETVEDSNLAQDAALKITIYKIEGLTTRWRVIVRNKPYSITNIDSISRISPVCELTLRSISEES